MIDVRKLRMLAQLEQRGTIAAAAEELQLTASAVSMQIAALERELGIGLTERQGRRVVLTPAGSLLARHGREVSDRLSLVELELDALRRGTVGRYTLAAFASAARTLVARVWGELVDEGLGMELRLQVLEPDLSVAALAAGRVDLALIHSYSNVARDLPGGVQTRHLADEPVWLACRADATTTEAPGRARLADFADHDWITPPSSVTCFSMVERACGLAGFRPRVVAESMDFSVQLELVAAGAGVALVPDLTVVSIPPGVVLRPLTQPVQRSILVAARIPTFSDRGALEIVRRLEATAARLVGSARPQLLKETAE